MRSILTLLAAVVVALAVTVHDAEAGCRRSRAKTGAAPTRPVVSVPVRAAAVVAVPVKACSGGNCVNQR
jgi:hypothetical protein